MLTTTISDAWSDGLDAKSPSALEYLQDCDRVFRQHVERVFGKVAYLWTVERGEEGGRWHRHYLWPGARFQRGMGDEVGCRRRY